MATVLQAAASTAAPDDDRPLHEDNEWQIEVVPAPEQDAEPSSSGAARGMHVQQPAAAGAAGQLPPGVEFGLPACGGVSGGQLRAEGVEDTSASTEDLMAQLSALNSR